MKNLSIKFRILDRPEGRKVHQQPTPLLGGIGIIVAFSLSLIANMIPGRQMLALLCGGIVLGFVGFLDDWKGVSARLKLLIQICMVLVLVHNDIILDLFSSESLWGYFGNIVLSVIWIVGITNAMNFFDGMDGLATGLSIIIGIFIGIVSFQTDQHFMGWTAIAIIGSCLGFLPYNFRSGRPAAMFLGDAGSTFLGFILAGLAIMGYWADNNRIVSFATPILIFWILIYDMAYITIERVFTGKVKSLHEWIDYVGTDHLHHRLYFLLGDKKKAVLTIFLYSATLGLGSIALRNVRTVDSILLVFQAFLIAVTFSIVEYAGRKRSSHQK